MNWRSSILIGIGLLFSGSALAQVPTGDSLALPDNAIDRVIEDAVQDVESDDQTDWTFVTDYLQDLQNKPLDLNKATKEELLRLPGMDELLATALLTHIARFGWLTSIYELQAVPGFTVNVYRSIRPYVYVSGSQAKDINPGVMHPSGPSLATVFSESKHEIMFRFMSLLEEQKGYTDPDTNSDGSLTSRFQGNPHRYYMRYRMRYEQNFSAALVAEKDQGERFIWDPERASYGFDFTAGHVFIKDYGQVKRLVVGDYNIQAGQGLLLSTGLGFGKGSQAVAATKRNDLGVRPYASVNENQFMRGAAATIAFDNFYFTPFFSRLGLDGNISSTDTLTNEAQEISSLQTSGFHRTEAELEDKDAIQEMMYGGRLQYKSRWLSIGATHFFQDYGTPIAAGSKDYQLFDFSGKQNYLTGLDFDMTVRNFNFFGELGRSKSGGTGMVLGILTSLSRNTDFSILYRDFDPDFHSTRGFAFAERPRAVQNERGVYLGLKVQPTRKLTVSAFFDKFWFPWHEYQTSFPSQGYETMAQVAYAPSRKMELYVRYRSDHKERNASVLPDGQRLEYLIPTVRDGLRFHFRYNLDRNIQIKTRAEFSWFKKGEEKDVRGFLAYQDLSYKIGWKWKLTGRYAIFNSDFDARIYAFENDVLGFFSIPAYSGVGSRYYAIVNYKPKRWLEFWARFARTHFYNERTIGSGLSEIQGNKRSELKLQMRFKF